MIENKQRIALGVEYIGTAYSGWQSQHFDQLPTIQDQVEKAIAKVANHPVQVICAGRTDAGVHAKGQVVHFETSAQRAEHNWILGINSNLPPDISVHWAKQMPEDFHARFSAIARQYQYCIYNHPFRSALYYRRATWIYLPLDIHQMQKATQYFIGEHDFTSFRAQYCQAKSPTRTIESMNIEQHDDLIILTIKANAFLHHMVRNIVGVLLPIGRGEKNPEWVEDVINAHDRKAAGVTAPADGLYLKRVFYPDKFNVPYR